MSPDLIRITKNTVIEKLPNPFQFENGSYVTSISDWEKRRKELLRLAVELPYGDILPEPEIMQTELLCRDKTCHTYRITAGPKESPVSFCMQLFPPHNTDNMPWPVVVDGDMCWDYSFDRNWLNAFLDSGIALCLFNRCEIVADNRDMGKDSPLYRAYPHLEFGALMAWAWGYSRCLDALLALGYTDGTSVAFTGHSRGGKTALIAGALDTRATVVNSNDSGCAGAGCYRNSICAIAEDGIEGRSETADDMIKKYGFWFSENFKQYYGNVKAMPFDGHYLKALIAPRILLEGNAINDVWANPVGSYQTAIAATEVYRFLGCPENHYWYYRKGHHAHMVEDVCRLAKLIQLGSKTDDIYYETPFERPAPIFDWRAPLKD